MLRTDFIVQYSFDLSFPLKMFLPLWSYIVEKYYGRRNSLLKFDMQYYILGLRILFQKKQKISSVKIGVSC